MTSAILGVIADDFTGATDIASMLVRGGMRVVQTIGVPSKALLRSIDADAVVVALKSRSIAAAEAVEQSLAAWAALSVLGVRQAYFKYCSTFDSTPAGNIGPVSEALAAVTGAPIVPHIPSLPVNGRTVYQGHLFVFDRLLNESGMETHPLNPMTDADLVRWLTRQAEHKVGLVGWARVAEGFKAISANLDLLIADGFGHVIGDAISDVDLTSWAQALADLPLVAGGSGLATPLARAHSARGRFKPATNPLSLAGAGRRPALILAGSCSKATLGQIARFVGDGGAAHRIDPRDIATDPARVDQAIAWARQMMGARPVLIYASGIAEEVRAAQEALGEERAGRIAEEALSRIASELAGPDGAERIIAAGGETSGAVVSALGVAALSIGPEIDPGVPWTEALDAEGHHLGWLALKSGNFGAEDFFAKALAMTETA
jgi:uncharacterized protein YgbK (DUF1537 family)